MYDLDLDVTFKFSLLFVASVATDQKSHMRPTYLSCFHANEGGEQTGGGGGDSVCCRRFIAWPLSAST